MSETATGTRPAIQARFPQPMIDAVDVAAQQAGMSRSAVLRDLVALGLASRGLWPPRDPRLQSTPT